MKTKSKKDIQELIDLKLAGKSYRQIGEITGISKDAVRNAIKELLPTDATEIFKKNRADILAELQRKILESCNQDNLAKVGFRDKVVCAGILHDKERLERGQSTVNHSVLFKIVDAACQERAKLGTVAKQGIELDTHVIDNTDYQE